MIFFLERLTYFTLIKNPLKIKRGRTTGTTNAPAASGVGTLSPITDPIERKKNKNREISIQILIFVYLPYQQKVIPYYKV